MSKLLRYSMQLAMLQQLLKSGKITESEYEKIKRKLMSDYHIVSDICA